MLGAEPFHGSKEAVAAAGECLDVAGAACAVAKGFSQTVDGGVDAVVVVDEGAIGPKLAADVFAGKQLAGALEKEKKDLEGLCGEPYPKTVAAKLAGGGICLEDSEAEAQG